jgi:hypothetical protein
LRKLKKKFNIIGNGEDRQIKYANWSHKKWLFKIWPLLSLSKERLIRISYNMQFLNQCLFERPNIYYLQRMDFDLEYFHLSVISCSTLCKSLFRYSDHTSNSGFYKKCFPYFIDWFICCLKYCITAIPPSVIVFISSFPFGCPIAKVLLQNHSISNWQ